MKHLLLFLKTWFRSIPDLWRITGMRWADIMYTGTNIKKSVREIEKLTTECSEKIVEILQKYE